MPIFIMSERQNYRVKGDTVTRWQRIKWWFAMMLGLPIRVIEDPTGNMLWISGKRIHHYVALSQAELDAATKAAAEAQNQAPPGKRNIIETPGMMIPRKRPN